MAVNKEAIIKKLKGNTNKIDIITLVDGYKKCATDNLKEKYLKDNIVVVPYIPFVQKMIIGKSIMKFSCFDNKGDFYVDSCKKYIETVYELITNYTNINFDPNDLWNGYDILCENGLIEPILALIPEHELKEISTIINMSYDDVMTNTYENHAFIKSILAKYIPLFEKLMKPVIEIAAKELQKE